MTDSLLNVKDLTIEYISSKGRARAVNGIDFSLAPGETLGLVGESGSGKSTVAYGVMDLLPPSAKLSGTIEYAGQRMGMIFQDPMQCLDPVYTIGAQLTETILNFEKISKSEAEARSIEMLRKVGIREPEAMMSRYQFELSGGMRQRVMIAMTMLMNPQLLIADEPTTALDVTIQDQILFLLKKEVKENNMAMLFITHSFGVVADVCDRVCVLYGGKVCELGKVEEVFENPVHPYTKGLLKAIPSMTSSKKEPLIPIDGAPINIYNLPEGCPFCDRCKFCTEKCRKQQPPIKEITPGHFAACWQENS